MVYYKDELVPIGDDELVQSITIILAAHGEKFPQLRGKAVSPERRDDVRRRFAAEMVERLKMARITFFRRGGEDPLSGNSKWFSQPKR